MYNMTRKLQYDFAEVRMELEQEGIPDSLYFWKENWMQNEQYSSQTSFLASS